MNTKENSKRLNFLVETETWENFKIIAAKKHKTMSALMKDMVKIYIELDININKNENK